MAITFVQEADNHIASGSGDLTITILPSTAGNLIVVTAFANGSGIANVTDNQSNTYTFIPATDAAGGASYRTSIWYLSNCPSGITSIIISSGFPTNEKSGCVLEYAGVDTISSLDTGGHISHATTYDGPVLTTTQTGDVAIVILVSNSAPITGVNSPYTSRFIENIGGDFSLGVADYIGAPTGMTQANFTPTTIGANGATSAAAFFASSSFLTLTLTDSVSFNDSTLIEDDKILIDSVTPSDSLTKTVEKPISDSTSVTDSFPQSFSVQSSFLVPVPIPIVETLTNAEIPAEVKTFWKFE